MRSRSRTTPADDRRIRELEAQVRELTARVEELQPVETGLLPAGKYRGRIADVDRKVSRAGKYYWCFKVKIDGRNRHVWYNVMERGLTPLERLCQDLGVSVREQVTPIPIEWTGPTPEDTIGKRVEVTIRTGHFGGRDMNEVREMSAA